MIIAKTPFRISLFGGGTDFPDFFNSYGATIISASIDKYCYVSVHKLPQIFEYKSIISYSSQERVNSYDEIKNPVVRESMRKLGMHCLKINYDSDLPARSGLGTSSSFAVGLLGAFHSLKSEIPTPKLLADEAIEVERKMCAEAGGWQDQIAVSFGGFNRIDFNDNSYRVSPIKITSERKEKLCSNLLLYFTGKFRTSKNIQNILNDNIKSKTQTLLKIKEISLSALEILENDNEDIDKIGYLLGESWNLKKKLNDIISNTAIDDMYDNALLSGALGGKLLGAGEGGFLLLYVPQKNKKAVCEKLKGYSLVPFSFSENGFSLIHSVPEIKMRGIENEE